MRGSTSDRVVVFLTPASAHQRGESPFQVRAGQRVDLTGTVKPVPNDVTPFGVDDSEGAGQLRSQGNYIEATRIGLAD
ncbi:MAG: hypothetical protein M3P85_12125 [Actinomycetota bacterium]|nr:hypothetical protein [Actinomycetota bacterium]